jgi:hypothetical protein
VVQVSAPHPDPERLALAALPAEPDDPAVVEHLQGCLECRAEVDVLRATVELAREGGDTGLPAPPPRVWQGIVAELGLSSQQRNGQVTASGGGTAPVESTAPDEAARPAAGPGAPRRLRRILVPLLAAVVGLLAGLGIGRELVSSGTPPTTGPVGRLAPVGDLDPAATGTIAMAGQGTERRMVLQVKGVANLDGGDHLEAWLMDPSGTHIVALGPLSGGNGEFHGTFALPEGLPLAEYGQVDVSAERWDGDPAHSTVSVLRGATP